MTDAPADLTLRAATGFPEVRRGDDVAALIADRVDLADGDLVCVAHKVVSKAEGALVAVDGAGDREEQRRRVALAEARRVVARAPWVLITETRQGLVCANSGVDASNAPPGMFVVLPDDPDASARRLRERLAALAGVDVGVVVTDTFGRPWRLGQTDVAVGCAGLAPLRDERGHADRRGQPLRATLGAVADAVAAAADLLRTKAAGIPVVRVRGLAGVGGSHGPGAVALQRPPAEDLFVRGRGAVADELAAPPAEPPAGAPVPAADLDRAVQAAASAGAEVVPLEAGASPTRLGGRAERPERAGAGAALVTAALIDLGHRARLARLDADDPSGIWAVVEAAAGPTEGGR